MTDIYIDDYTGTDEQMINAAVAALTPGDTLHFASREYTTQYNAIYLPERVTVDGHHAWIHYIGTGTAVRLANKNAGYHTEHLAIKNLHLRTQTGQNGFYLHGPRYCRFEMCGAVGFSGAGFVLNAGGTYQVNGIDYFFGAWWNKLELCYAWHCQNGLILTGQHQAGQANANTIDRCTFMANHYGKPTFNEYAELTGAVGVRVEEGNSNTFLGCDVSKNDVGFFVDDKQFTAVGSYVEFCDVGFQLEAAAGEAVIFGSRFVNVTTRIGGASESSANVVPVLI